MTRQKYTLHICENKLQAHHVRRDYYEHDRFTKVMHKGANLLGTQWDKIILDSIVIKSQRDIDWLMTAVLTKLRPGAGEDQ